MFISLVFAIVSLANLETEKSAFKRPVTIYNNHIMAGDKLSMDTLGLGAIHHRCMHTTILQLRDRYTNGVIATISLL